MTPPPHVLFKHEGGRQCGKTDSALKTFHHMSEDRKKKVKTRPHLLLTRATKNIGHGGSSQTTSASKVCVQSLQLAHYRCVCLCVCVCNFVFWRLPETSSHLAPIAPPAPPSGPVSPDNMVIKWQLHISYWITRSRGESGGGVGGSRGESAGDVTPRFLQSKCNTAE